jgi:phosphopantetheinyl transferase
MLGAADIHLWQIDLANGAWDAYSAALSGDEIRRYSRLYDPIRRQWHRRARIALRFLLGRYLNRDARSVQITHAENGKPRAAGAHVHFNLSHSESRALIGVSLTPLGVDLERVEGRLGLNDLLRQVCHPRERRTWEDLEPASRRAAFYRLWVGKEAYCKAIGEGLRKPMDSFWLQQRKNQPCYDVIDPAAAGHGYLLHCLPVGEGWSAALCSAQPAPRLSGHLNHACGPREVALFDGGPCND